MGYCLFFFLMARGLISSQWVWCMHESELIFLRKHLQAETDRWKKSIQSYLKNPQRKISVSTDLDNSKYHCTLSESLPCLHMCVRLSTESVTGVIWDDDCKFKRLLMLIRKTLGGRPVHVPQSGLFNLQSCCWNLEEGYKKVRIINRTLFLRRDQHGFS